MEFEHFNLTLLNRRLRGKNGSVKKTSEALEIERIKALQDETKKKLKSNETFLQKALAPQAVMQTKRATEVTKTMEFNFATDVRIKQHPMKTRSDASDNEKFTDQLRKHPPSPVSYFYLLCVTVIIGFCLFCFLHFCYKIAGVFKTLCFHLLNPLFIDRHH